ncbi:unnamed protein product, partial [Symbiodinium pilosum]
MMRCAIETSGVSFSLALSSCQVGQWRRAVSILRSMHLQELRLNEFSASTAIQSLVSATPQGAVWRATLATLSRLELTSAGLDRFCFNAVLSVCEPRAAWTLALRLFDGFRARRFQPDEVSYTSVLASFSGASASGRWLYAADLLSRMAAAWIAWTDEAAIAATAASAQCTQWSHSLEVLGVLKHRIAQGSAAAAVVAACTAAGKPLPAAAVLTELDQRLSGSFPRWSSKSATPKCPT